MPSPRCKWPTMGELWAIYVASSHWDKGVGLALWDAAREGLQDEGCTHVSVWLPIANERAMRFHELAGFKREMASAKTVPIGTVKTQVFRGKQLLREKLQQTLDLRRREA